MSLHPPPIRLAILFTVFGLSFLGSQAAHAGYKFTRIDALGSNDTEVYGVTNDGLITGLTYDANGTAHGFIWRNGVMKLIDYPGQGPLGTVFYQANESGQV